MTGLAAQAHELLVELLKAEGWSARELSRRSGVGHATIARALAGTQSPSLETFEKMLSGFGLTGTLDIRFL